MKKFILIICLALACINMYPQLRMNSMGKVFVGISQLPNSLSFSPFYHDTIPALHIYGPCGGNGDGARITFGYNLLKTSKNVQIGELGTTNTDILWLHGKHGVYFTHNGYANDTICYYNDNKGNYFQFNCPIRATEVYMTSDEAFKSDIEPLEENGLLMKLKPVQYNLLPNLPELSEEMYGEMEETDAKFYRDFYEKAGKYNLKYGLLAQDLEKVFPNLVMTDTEGKKYVDYIGLIPLLIDAVNNLNAQVDELKYEKEQAKRLSTFNGMSGLSNAKSEAYLSQNRPNPFNSSSVIDYRLPENTAVSQINFYDMQGKFVRSYQLDASKVESSLMVSSSDFTEGMYLYALIADGNEIDVKRMIISK